MSTTARMILETLDKMSTPIQVLNNTFKGTVDVNLVRVACAYWLIHNGNLYLINNG